MTDQPKSSDASSGTYSRHASASRPAEPGRAGESSGAGGAAHDAAARHENRFAEVTRKAREARGKLDAVQQARLRRDSAQQDARDYEREAGSALAGPEAATTPHATDSSASRSAFDRAAAALGGDGESDKD